MRSSIIIGTVLLASQSCFLASAADDNTKPLPPIPASAPRGVLRAHLDRYDTAKTTFTCLDGSKTMPIDRVNDEYCDCKDGSDEPGTAACSLETISAKDWYFRCADSGSQFKDRTFKHSQVNDGICDCCDGSDEYAGHVECPNTCAELAEIEDRETKIREEKRRLGLEAKKLMELETESKIEVAIKVVKENEVKAKEIQDKLDALHPKKEAAEEIEKQEREVHATKHREAEAAWEVKQKVKLSESHLLKPHWSCVRWAQTKDCKGDGVLEGKNRTCSELIVSSASGFCVCRKPTPAHLAKIRSGDAVRVDAADADLAKEGEVKAEEEAGDDELPEDDNINPIKHPEAFNRQQEERLVGVEAEDTNIYRDCVHDAFTCNELCEFGGDEALLKAHKEKYAGDTHDGRLHENVDAKTIRNEINVLENDKRSADAAVTAAKKSLEVLQQSDITAAFRSMNGYCYERQLHNYKYKFCPFQKAEQDHISLGTWTGFGEQTYSSWGAKHDFSVMKFEGGATCWGGPARSLTVRVICGPENEILSIEEPSMCTYVVKFQSPAICE